MRPGILTEHGFKHKGNLYATLPWFGTKIGQKHAKRIKTKTWSTPRSQVLNFRAASGHNVLYMRNDVSKEISRFRFPSSGWRRLLLKVPSKSKRRTWTPTHSLISLQCGRSLDVHLFVFGRHLGFGNGGGLGRGNISRGNRCLTCLKGNSAAGASWL